MIILFAVIYSVEAKCELHFDLISVQTKTCLLRSYLNKLLTATGQSSFNSEFSGFRGMIENGGECLLVRLFSPATETH